MSNDKKIKNSLEHNKEENLISPILPTYARMDVTFEHGQGVYLYDQKENKYLDFGSGIAVSCLGHCHPKLVNALTEQANKVWHTSNIYHISGQEKLAKRLCNATFADSVFFTNSGAEAVECAIKMARRYHNATGQPDRYRIITFEGSFHGRTLATIAAGGSEKLTKGFGPVVDGFDNLPFYKNMAEVEAFITDETAGIMIEPVQGEGGIRPVSAENLQILRDLCNKHGILLIYDEIQCGMGRTGKLFYHHHSGITPDIMPVAKGIGGGFPLGACLTIEKVAEHMTVGTHGSTYGGNPMGMAMGNAVLDVFEEEHILDNVTKMSDKLRLELLKLKQKHPEIIKAVRGLGLMMGLKLSIEPRDFVIEALNNKLLVVGASERTVRLLPPLNITETEIDEAIALLHKTCTKLTKKRNS